MNEYKYQIPTLKSSHEVRFKLIPLRKVPLTLNWMSNSTYEIILTKLFSCIFSMKLKENHFASCNANCNVQH